MVRYFGERTIILGWWKDQTKDEDDAMRRALQAHETEVLDDDGALLDRYRHDDEPETVHVG